MGWMSEESQFSPWQWYKISLFKVSRLVLGHTQPPVERVPGILYWGQISQAMKLTTHPNLVPRLSTSGVIHPFPICLRGVQRDSFIFTVMEKVHNFMIQIKVILLKLQICII
jgi:hypothetical protein